MSTADLAAVISAVAAAASALLAVIIAYLAFAALRQDKRSSDFGDCVDAVTRLGDAQRRVFEATTPEKKQFEFRELLNLMEALALLENDKRVAPSTRKFTVPFIQESYAFLRSQPQLVPLLEDSITSDTTFAELAKFAEKHKAKIESLTRLYQRQSAEKLESSSQAPAEIGSGAL